tara:strand:+ start:2654 stop:3007 length:354 start_codon:yes stop_codon:yes gene_type:complete
MDIDNYLKNYLNKDGHIKYKNLEEIIPQLKSLILPKLKDKKLDTENMKIILHDALSELGWSKEQILKLSELRRRSKKKSKSINKQYGTSRGWGKVGQIKTTPEIYQGGSPGLGKGKS